MSTDVVFDESTSWYLPLTPTLNSNLINEDESSEPETNRDEDEEARDFLNGVSEFKRGPISELRETVRSLFS